jgi:heat shock protein HtpX
MSRREIEGVLAHELSHVANGDMVTMSLLQGVVNAFVMFLARIAAFAVRVAMSERRDGERGGGGLAWMVSFAVQIVLEIVLGILGSLIVAWFSRQREFRADAGAARLAGRENMIAALRRLMGAEDRIDTSNSALATFKIAGSSRWLTAFSTHPPLADRIRALEDGALD